MRLWGSRYILWTVYHDTHMWERSTRCTHILDNLFHLINPRHFSKKKLFVIRRSSVQAAKSTSPCVLRGVQPLTIRIIRIVSTTRLLPYFVYSSYSTLVSCLNFVYISYCFLLELSEFRLYLVLCLLKLSEFRQNLVLFLLEWSEFRLYLVLFFVRAVWISSISFCVC